MDSSTEHRYEQRLAYRWPIWFGRDITQAVFPALMVDVSSAGMAFTCKAGPCRPEEGQAITVRFSLPRFDETDPGATIGITRTGVVRWTADLADGTRKVGLRFDTALSLKPAEQAALFTLRRV